MAYTITVGINIFQFKSLKDLMAKASPLRSADQLAEIAAENQRERIAAQMCLADLPLKKFLDEPLIPAEHDEVSRLIDDKRFIRKLFHEALAKILDTGCSPAPLKGQYNSPMSYPFLC